MSDMGYGYRHILNRSHASTRKRRPISSSGPLTLAAPVVLLWFGTQVDLPERFARADPLDLGIGGTARWLFRWGDASANVIGNQLYYSHRGYRPLTPDLPPIYSFSSPSHWRTR